MVLLVNWTMSAQQVFPKMQKAMGGDAAGLNGATYRTLSWRVHRTVDRCEGLTVTVTR